MNETLKKQVIQKCEEYDNILDVLNDYCYFELSDFENETNKINLEKMKSFQRIAQVIIKKYYYLYLVNKLQGSAKLAGNCLNDKDRITKLYYNCKCNLLNEDYLEFEDLLNFSKQLNLNPQSIELLIIFWKLKPNNCYSISKDEFINGFLNLDCSSIKEIKLKCLI
eukprot:gene314-6728_t